MMLLIVESRAKQNIWVNLLDAWGEEEENVICTDSNCTILVQNHLNYTVGVIYIPDNFLEYTYEKS